MDCLSSAEALHPAAHASPVHVNIQQREMKDVQLLYSYSNIYSYIYMYAAAECTLYIHCTYPRRIQVYTRRIQVYTCCWLESHPRQMSASTVTAHAPLQTTSTETYSSMHYCTLTSLAM